MYNYEAINLSLLQLLTVMKTFFNKYSKKNRLFWKIDIYHEKK